VHCHMSRPDTSNSNAYRKISFSGIEFNVPGVNPYDQVDLHLIPDDESCITEIRYWNHDKLVASQNIKNADLNRVRF
ncbi:MAG TPA: hypothetical protein VI728_00130, partial [Syntrophales bacterium]|nr:hypothetical protein [Syntrophales bacterium]